ncbi:MAG: TlpA family protein disulfide reductase [Verrucomicrobiae bacterium]|nr:TlpA family protein disulfide reductase [Verrucomicrobiae bacterium]
MKNSILSLTLAVILTSPVFAETAAEIASGFDQQKIAALQAYLEKNPEATDKDEALSMLVGAHLGLGDFAPVPDLLSKRYEAQDKGGQANLGVIVNEIVRPFIESSIASNQRDKAKAFITRVKTDLADHPQGGQVSQFLDQIGGELFLPGVGDEMKIAFTDLKGHEIDLSKMSDKVVLVDFWATWCGPCVAEMPNVIAAYEKYKDKGFEVIGISLDEDKGAVEKFVSDRGVTWPQYFDGKGWENELAQRFGIGSIPATFLVGKGGKIVASNLRGPALEEAIEKALGSE